MALDKDNAKAILKLIKRQLIDMQWNLAERKQWIEENNPRLLEWNSSEIKGHYVIIKGCLTRISKRIS